MVITIVAAILFLPYLGNVHLFDWDEINFAECAREMLVTKNYLQVQLNYLPFWEKPPFFIWMQALSMKIFGVNEFAARFPNAFCGIATLNVLFAIGRSIYNIRFGIIWVLVYIGSFLPFLYFKSGIIDPWFNLFIFLSVYFILLLTNNPSSKNAWKNAFASGFFAGLSLLTKGPAGPLIIGLCIIAFFFLNKRSIRFNWSAPLLFILSFLLTGLSWFLLMFLSGHKEVIQEFITYQVRLFKTHDSGHEGFLLYHFIVLLIGCFPASLFLILAHKKSPVDSPFQLHIKRWMLALFWVVLILFTIVQTKIVHYSSMCYFPLSYLAAYSIYKLMSGEYKWNSVLLYSGIFLSMLIAIAIMFAGSVEHWKDFLLKPGIIKDEFARQSLMAEVKWNGWEWLLGLVYITATHFILGRIHRQSKLKLLPLLFIVNTGLTFFAGILIVPKIEKYSQSAPIEFYESLKNKNVYLETVGFKSYAYLFYSDRMPQHHSEQLMQYALNHNSGDGHTLSFNFNHVSANWMLTEKIDRDAYFVLKCTDDLKSFTEKYQAKEIYRKNGFVFFIREKNN